MSLQPGSSMVHHGLNPHNNLGEEVISEDEARKRREQLNRRPSYRMILKDLETADKNLKKEPEEATSGGSPGSAAVTAPITSDPLHVQIPAPVPMPRQPGLSAAASSPYASPSAAVSAGLLPPAALNALHAHGALNGGADLMAHGLDYSNQAAVAAVVAASRGAGGHGRLTPSSSQDLSQQSTPTGSSGQLMVNPDLLGLKPMSDLSAPNSFGGGQGFADWQSPLLSGGYTSSPSPPMPGGSRGGEDESSRKRQVRLLKNREAAKECRRKKKEYVKCLENRVAVLENQNKALIEELKTLKELYCRKEKNEM